MPVVKSDVDATYAAKSAGGMSATAEMARREELLPIPFAKLMAVFQDPNLNLLLLIEHNSVLVPYNHNHFRYKILS